MRKGTLLNLLCVILRIALFQPLSDVQAQGGRSSGQRTAGTIACIGGRSRKFTLIANSYPKEPYGKRTG